MDRLNLTSDDARTRVGLRINDRYRRVTSSIGLQVSRRTVVDLAVDPTDPDSELPDLKISNMEKVLKVTRIVNDSVFLLKELTYDEITLVSSPDANPHAFAVKRMGNNYVIITLDTTPTTAFTLRVEGYEIAPDLADNIEPVFPLDFHDILVEGAMSDELRKMEKPQLAQISESKYEQRLSDLRMFIAKSAYLDIAQGKDKPGQLWYRPWFNRISVYE